MTALSVLLGWLVAGRALRPLQQHHRHGAARLAGHARRAHRAARARATSSRSWPTPSTRMLERLSGAFASQRRFVANASHELRTPLTVMRTELEVTLADPDATNAELRDMAEAVHDAMDRTERLVQSLLTLARSEGAVTRRDAARPRRAARLAARARRARRADAAGLRVTADLAPRARVAATGACSSASWPTSSRTPSRHNRPGGRVSVTTSQPRRAQRRRASSTTATLLDRRRAAAPARALPAHRPRRPRRRRRPRAVDRRAPSPRPTAAPSRCPAARAAAWRRSSSCPPTPILAPATPDPTLLHA